MKILVISKYPTPSSPQLNIFVYKLVQEMVNLGHKITVISPAKITLKNIFLKGPFSDKAEVYQPLFLSCSNKHIGTFNTNYLTHKFSVNAIKRVLKRNKIQYDIIYCHFWEYGFIVADALPSITKPLFLAFGDSKNHFRNTLSFYSNFSFNRLLKLVSGYISVSNENTETLLNYSIYPENIILAPNATDPNVFYPRDRLEMRQKYNISWNKKVVIFVGGFNESKGFNRVLEAIRDLDEVFGIFLGKGRIKQEYGKVLFKGCVKHFQLAEMLSCADVFVLPTQDEGSCNAIVEAMSCGLPIISSDIPAVREQCNSSFSILINPNSVEEIRDAIASIIYDKVKLHNMSNNAKLHATKFTLNERAKIILSFIEKYK